MRKIFFLMCAALCASFVALGAPANAGTFQNGSYSGTPSTIVTNLFAQFPNGGPALSDAIAQLLTTNPTLAADIAFVAAKGSTGQQTAAGTGMAQAKTALTSQGNAAGANDITGSVQQSGSATLQAAAALASDIAPVTFSRRCTIVSPSTTTCE